MADTNHERREDDQVDENGAPLSPAHRALAAELHVVREELEEHVTDVHSTLPREIAARLHADIAVEVRRTLAAGDFELPDGRRPQTLLAEHGNLGAGQDRLENRQKTIAHQVELLADAVIGECYETFDGDTRRRTENGLQSKVADIDERLGNGGITTRLRTQDRVAIYSAIIIALGTILGAAFGLF